MALRNRTAVTAAIFSAALVAWLVTVARMRGMDAGPGMGLGGLGWFIGIWVTMTAAMMLPSAAPAVLVFAHYRPGARVYAFVAGYLLAWSAFGLLAYGAYRALNAYAPSLLMWDEEGAWVAGGALIFAGAYQLTPLKHACLRRCRSPLGLVTRPQRPLWAGLVYGTTCIGCCFGLMLALFALGVMSLFWMGLMTIAIFVEKVLPAGERATPWLGGLLIWAGFWIVVVAV